MKTNENSLEGKTLRQKYYIDQLLSDDLQGGQGKVYYATDTSVLITKKYIIKQFIPNYKNDYLLEIGTRLFKQEADILQKLGSHSQIPQIVDYFTDNQQFFLVQEWIEGQNFKQELNSKQILSESAAISLLQDTLEVLKFVHQNNYIHRDIKPSNLIRNKYDQKIYLIDFGAVKEKIAPENIDHQGSSYLTVPIGTEGYMPIEQLRGTPQFNSDIYALGMVLIQSLTGLPPSKLQLENNTYNPIWREHIPTSIQNYNPNFLNLIDRMVRSHHQERYQSAAEVLRDLSQINLVSFPESLSDEDDSITSEIEPVKEKSLLPWIAGIATVCAVGIAGVISFGNTDKYVAYGNEEYGINLEYPDQWSIRENWMSLQPGVNFLSPLESNADNFREKMSVSIEELVQPLSLKEYTAQATEQIEGFNTIIEAAQETTFANREGRKIVYQEKDGNKKRMEVWMIKNQQVYIATYTAESEKFDKYLKQANQIIQSLTINK